MPRGTFLPVVSDLLEDNILIQVNPIESIANQSNKWSNSRETELNSRDIEEEPTHAGAEEHLTMTPFREIGDEF
jgi:hypothetical protein